MAAANRRLWLYVVPPVLVLAVVNLFVLDYLGLLPWLRETPASSNRVEHVLRDGRLADLPPSATDVRVHSWAGFFTGEHYLMFRASPEDIQRFLSASCGLRSSSQGISDDPMAPAWFTPSKAVGRLFEISPDSRGHNWGWVQLDEKENVVYIKVIWS